MRKDTLHMAVGIMGNAASLLLYASPILTFGKVVRKKSSEGYLCIPYMMALLNSLLYTWYGLPVVSCEWENFPLVTINGVGTILEISFISIYMWFASTKQKRLNSLFLVSLLLIFGTSAMMSIFSFHDHHHRKIFIGSIGLIASVSMYCSPLLAVKQVIETRSVEFMPFYLSLFSFIASSLWLAYGLLGRDLLLAAPNLVGCPVGLLQLILYFIYNKSNNKDNEDAPHDDELMSLEKHGSNPTLDLQSPNLLK